MKNNIDIDYTLELLEAEIDSLADAYKSETIEELKTEYSSRILSHKIALKILKKGVRNEL